MLTSVTLTMPPASSALFFKTFTNSSSSAFTDAPIFCQEIEKKYQIKYLFLEISEFLKRKRLNIDNLKKKEEKKINVYANKLLIKKIMLYPHSGLKMEKNGTLLLKKIG